MNSEFKQYLLQCTKATNCRKIEVIQSLWSGYGEIARYRLVNSRFETVVVKSISAATKMTHPRGWNTTVGHNRKVKSYQVETNWYTHWNARTTNACRTPSCLGSFSVDEKQWIVLEDLNKEYPSRRQGLDLSEVKVCLEWLAHFHARFMTETPEKLWEIGTYWHLATRPEEFEKITHLGLKAKAHLLDERLNKCHYQTLVHGDAKVANFCFSNDGKKVAAVDFQYVGGGCGVKDVAYFLGSCLSGEELEIHTEDVLSHYFTVLKTAVESSEGSINADFLEEEWRELYPIACADFTRFLLGWMPTHQKLNDYSYKVMSEVLESL